MRCLADEDKSPEVSSLLETVQATAAPHRPRVGEPTRTNITRQKKKYLEILCPPPKHFLLFFLLPFNTVRASW